VAVILAAAVVIGAVLTAAGAATRGSRPWVAFARLISPSFGVVVTSSTNRTHLFVTADGRRWRDVTPQHVLFQPEDAVFLDRRHGWFVANDCAAGRGVVYRTGDAARTWKATRVESTNCAAGSALDLSFLDRKHGWLVRTFENAPGADLVRTIDGGVSWGHSAQLPMLGRVSFRTPRDGLLARSDFAWTNTLFATHDGGLTWSRRTLTLPPAWRGARIFADLPTFFGARGLLPVTVFTPRRSAIAFYVSSDGGRTWAARIVQPVGFRTLRLHNPFPVYVPSSIASPGIWWAVTSIARPRVLLTTDAGKHWTASRPPALDRAAWAEITSAGDKSAWLTLRTRNGQTLLLATTDGGRSWRRLAVPRE